MYPQGGYSEGGMGETKGVIVGLHLLPHNVSDALYYRFAKKSMGNQQTVVLYSETQCICSLSGRRQVRISVLFSVITKEVKNVAYCCNVWCIRVGRIYWLKTGATHYHRNCRIRTYRQRSCNQRIGCLQDDRP